MTNNLKKAVITGSSSGIGFSISKLLLENGWKVIGISRNIPVELASHPLYSHIEADLSKPEIINKIVHEIPTSIDLLVNNAGRWDLVNISNESIAHINEIIDLNLKAPIILTTLILNRIKDGGTIINISSILSQVSQEEYGIYSSSKAGLDRFTVTLTKERKDLKVVGILPSATETEGSHRVYGENEDYDKYIPPKTVANIMYDIVNGKYESGDLLVINNKNFSYLWQERDKYILVEV